jgi:HPt (histidine-containing phosphotransfer) domain-containing protein
VGDVIRNQTPDESYLMAETPAIDPSAVSNLRELNPGDNGEFLREIISIYLEDTPKRIGELKASLASGDAATFTRAAHTIKGSSSNVGAVAIRGVAERMELLSKRQGLSAMATLVADCEAEFARAAAELRAISG